MMRISRRMTLSRVRVLPRMLIRSNVTSLPRWISKVTSTSRLVSSTAVWGMTLT